jgi:hypothetical protein
MSGFGLVSCESSTAGLSACRLLESDDLALVVRRPVGAATPFTPEGDQRTTGCRIGTKPDPNATVFVMHRNAAARFNDFREASPRLGAVRDLHESDYQAFVVGTRPETTLDPEAVAETLLLLWDDTLVKVDMSFVPAGSADRLAPLIAARVR